MRPLVKYIVGATALLITAAGLVVLACAGNRERKAPECRELKVHFADNYRFVDEEEVHHLIFEGYGNYMGISIDEIGLADIERVLEARSSVNSAEAWVTDDGVLHVSIRQRVPVVLLLNGEDGTYVDRDGFTFPMTEGYRADVPVIYGKYPDDGIWIRNVIEMIRTKEASALPVAATDSISTKCGEIFLHPAGRSEIFSFGKPEEFEKKLQKMQDYFDLVLPQADSLGYKSVDLKYKGQIICK